MSEPAHTNNKDLVVLFDKCENDYKEAVEKSAELQDLLIENYNKLLESLDPFDPIPALPWLLDVPLFAMMTLNSLKFIAKRGIFNLDGLEDTPERKYKTEASEKLYKELKTVEQGVRAGQYIKSLSPSLLIYFSNFLYSKRQVTDVRREELVLHVIANHEKYTTRTSVGVLRSQVNSLKKWNDEKSNELWRYRLGIYEECREDLIQLGLRDPSPESDSHEASGSS